MLQLPFLALAFACTETPDSGTGAPPIYTTNTNTQPECGGTPPLAESLTLEDAGVRYYESLGEEYPSARLTLVASDADADLHTVTTLWWWDTVPDGVIADDAQTQTNENVTVATERCTTGNAIFGLYLPIGHTVQADLTYDFAGQVVDWNGDESQILSITAQPVWSSTTP